MPSSCRVAWPRSGPVAGIAVASYEKRCDEGQCRRHAAPIGFAPRLQFAYTWPPDHRHRMKARALGRSVAARRTDRAGPTPCWAGLSSSRRARPDGQVATPRSRASCSGVSRHPVFRNTTRASGRVHPSPMPSSGSTISHRSAAVFAILRHARARCRAGERLSIQVADS
jgi:hypothetical protein